MEGLGLLPRPLGRLLEISVADVSVIGALWWRWGVSSQTIMEHIPVIIVRLMSLFLTKTQCTRTLGYHDKRRLRCEVSVYRWTRERDLAEETKDRVLSTRPRNRI